MPGTVTVASKLPHTMLLRVFAMEATQELIMGGGVRETTRAVEKPGSRMQIAGVAAPYGRSPAAPIAGGYALTHGVDADAFEEWMRQNASSDMVRNKLIWSHAKQDAIAGFTRDHEGVRSGLEPMARDDDPRMPKGAVEKSDLK